MMNSISGDDNRTKKVNKLDWSARTKALQQSLSDLYYQLITFRKSSSAIKSDNVHFFHHDSDHHITAYHRWANESNDSVVVLFNFSTEDKRNYRINNWPKNGRWQEVIPDQMEMHIDENHRHLDLKSYGYQIFVFKG